MLNIFISVHHVGVMLNVDHLDELSVLETNLYFVSETQEPTLCQEDVCNDLIHFVMLEVSLCRLFTIHQKKL